MSNRKDKVKLWEEFKKFISKGNVIDMAVGVIMGSAFSAIVTAVTNILLSICTWGVPGGLKGLVTVLPALNDAQKGMDAANGLGQFFESTELQTLATTEANHIYGADVIAENPNLIESVKTTILGKYTLHGTTYTYNMSATIDWGALINAVIAFLIISLFLFTVVKTFAYLQKKRAELKAAELELYYQKHPEERPVPAPEAPKAPTEVELLTDIKALLEKQNGVTQETKSE